LISGVFSGRFLNLKCWTKDGLKFLEVLAILAFPVQVLAIPHSSTMV